MNKLKLLSPLLFIIFLAGLPGMVHATITADQAANIVLGQQSFFLPYPNQGGYQVNQMSLSYPHFSTFDSSGNLWVADTANNRVLEFKPPFTTNEVASVVLGQPNLISSMSDTSSTAFHYPISLAFDPSGDLWVVDQDNNRVLEFLPANLITGGAAAVVLGQPNLTSDNHYQGGGLPSANSLSNSFSIPSSLAFDPSSGNLLVVDSGNNRVLEFVPSNLVTDGAAAVVLGQPDFTSNEFGVSPTNLHNPTSIAFDSSNDLWVTDSGNNRVLEFLTANLVIDGAAAVVLGQQSFVSHGSGNSQNTLSYPSGITFDTSGDLWITDKTNHRVLEFLPANLVTNGAAAVVLGQPGFAAYLYSTSSNALYNPSNLGFDPSGNLWVSDSGNNRVLEFPTANLVTNGAAAIALGQPNLNEGSSNQQDVINSTDLNYTTGAVLDQSGDLWVADTANSRVLEFKPPFTTNESAYVVLGQQSFLTSGSGISPTNLTEPTALAFDPSGDLWVADTGNSRVLKFLPSNLVTGGAAAAALGCTDLIGDGCINELGISSATFAEPTSLAFDPSGDLWVADFELNRVLEFLPANLTTGGAAAVAIGCTDFVSPCEGTTSTTLTNPTSIAFDAAGNLWVADTGNNRVLEFPEGNLTTGGTANTAIGQLDMNGGYCNGNGGSGIASTTLCYPYGILFDPSNNLWVADVGNNRVLEFPEGNLITGGAANTAIGQPNMNSGYYGYPYRCFTASTTLCNPAVDFGFYIPPAADGIAFDAAGDLWVTDTGNNRVLEYTNVQHPPLLTLTPSNAVIESGQNETYTVAISDGISPYTVNFYNLTGDSPLQAFGYKQYIPTTNYPTLDIAQSCLNSNNIIYCIAGGGNGNGNINSVYYAPIMPSGELGTWTSTTNYPFNSTAHSCVKYGGNIYCIAGATYMNGNQNATYYAPILNTGALGAWTPTTSYPLPDAGESCVTYSNNIYCIGGATGISFYQETPVNATATNDVYYAPILPSGALGTWTNTTGYPMPDAVQSCVVSSNNIYCIAGSIESGGVKVTGFTNETYYAPILNSGALGAWTPTTTYPIQTSGQSCLTSSGDIFCIGGATSLSLSAPTATNATYYAPILNDGALGAWTPTTGYPFPIAVQSCMSSSSNYIYCVAGYTPLFSAVALNDVFYAPISASGIANTLNYTFEVYTPRPQAEFQYDAVVTEFDTVNSTSLANTIFVTNALGVNSTTTTTIPQGGGGGGGGSGGLPGTTSSVTSTSTTTIPVTSTIPVLVNSSYNITANVPIVVNVSGTGTIVTLSSSKSIYVKLIVVNVTKSVVPPQSYVSIVTLNVSTLPPTNITITLSIKYPCNLPSSSIAPYIKTGTGWVEISNFSLNPDTCTVTVTIPTDPIVGLFYKQQTSSSTIIPSIAPTTSTILTTVIQSRIYSSGSTILLLVLAFVIIIVVVAVLIFRKRK